MVAERKHLLTLRTAFGAILLVAVGNLMVFFAVTLFLGGSASEWDIAGGKYYLVDHSNRTEVSERTFVVLQWYEIGTWLLLFISMVLFLLVLLTEKARSGEIHGSETGEK